MIAVERSRVGNFKDALAAAEICQKKKIAKMLLPIASGPFARRPGRNVRHRSKEPVRSKEIRMVSDAKNWTQAEADKMIKQAQVAI